MKTTNRRHFEREDQAFYESMKRPGDGLPMYACLRAYPIARTIGPGRVISMRTDFFGVADMVCFRTDEPGIVFVQSTSSDTENPSDMVRSLNDHTQKIRENWFLPYEMHLVWHFKAGGRWKRQRYRIENGKRVSLDPDLCSDGIK